MKRLRFFAALLLAFSFLWTLPASGASAAAPSFSFRLNSPSASAGETVALNVGVGAGIEIAGFRLRVSFDSSVLRFAGVSTAPQIAQDTLQTNPDSDPVCSVYVCGVDRGAAPQLSGTVVTYLFQVRPNAPAGATDVCASVDETCDYSAKNMYLDSYGTLALNVLPAPSGRAYLADLQPSEGELEPAFSPGACSYRLRVGSAVNSVTFQADAADGASVKVSRRSLSAAGSETPIMITVTSADQKAKTVYCVTVSRAAKEPESGTSGGDNLSSGKPSGRTNTASKKPSGRTAASGSGRSSSSSAAELALAAAKAGKKASLPVENIGPASALPAQRASGQAAVQALSAAAAAPLTVVQSQMPSYMVGMLAAGFCIVAGILLSVWFRLKKK